MSSLRRLVPFLCVLAVASACGPGEAGDLALEQPFSETGRYLVELTPAPAEWMTQALVAQAPGVLSAEKASLQAAVPGLVVKDTLDELPMLVVEVPDAATWAALATHPRVAHVWPDSRSEASDTESFAYVGQPAAVAAGATGLGATVAVLDTGLTWTHPAFGTCPTVGATGCSVAYVQDFAASDGQLDDNGHGTNVAGIVVGMAPRARVIGLDVFAGTGAYAADIIAAINWVIANKGRFNIVAMNLSLGGGFSPTTCDADVFATPIAAARTAGVLAVVAAGNEGRTTGLSSPACAPAALSVGAVYDTALGGLGYGACSDPSTAPGQVTCFSNSAPFLSLLAPGAAITAAGTTMFGTSQAAPHVAGALAVLAAKYPTDTASKRASRLLSGAPTVRDARNGVVRPRLQLGASPGVCSVTVSPEVAAVTATGGTVTFTVTTAGGTACGWTLTGAPAWLPVTPLSGTTSGTVRVTLPANPGAARTGLFQVAGVLVTVSQAADTTPPTGTLVLPALTRVTSVTATLTASDPSGVSAVCLSTGATCTAWQAWSASKPVTLPAGDGVKTVSAWFRDARGNASATPVTATTRLDGTAPVGGALTAVAATGSIRLTWSGFTDATSGVAKYRLVQSTTTADPVAGCTSGTVYEGTALTFTVTGVPAKSTRRFRVCAFDAAGNVSAGVLKAATTP